MPILPPGGRPWSEVMTTFLWKILAKPTNFEVSSLGLELHVSILALGLGAFGEVSVSSQNFNQVSVSKVTVSTASLQIKSVNSFFVNV